MPRNAGAVIDTVKWQVRDRDRRWHPLDELVVDDAGLYYARPVEDFREFDYQWRWLLPGPGWVVNAFRFLPSATRTFDWYIETDIINTDAHRWTIGDGYLDIYVWDGIRYELEDAGELAGGITAHEISVHDATQILHSLDRLCEELRRNGVSGAALLRDYAPDLPPAPQGGDSSAARGR